MDDDLNTPVVISVLFDCVRTINQIYDGHRTISEADLKELARVVRLFVFDILGLRDDLAGGNCADARLGRRYGARYPPAGQSGQGLGDVRPDPRRAYARSASGSRIARTGTTGKPNSFRTHQIKPLPPEACKGFFRSGGLSGWRRADFGFGRSGGGDVSALLAAVQILVCAIKRGEQVYIPDGNFVIEKGDRMHVVASHQNLKSFFRALGHKEEKVKKVMICGGGHVCFYLAVQLQQAGMQVKIIEQNQARCEELCELLPKATIIHGDATDQELLIEEGLENANAIVALTGMDEENIMMALFAKTRGIKKIVAKVNADTRAQMVESLGIESTVSAKSATADAILAYVKARMNSYSSANIETMYRLLNGKIVAQEYIINKECDFTNTPLKDLPTKPNNLIACIGRHRRIIIPNGDDHLEVGDSVIVIAKEHTINDFKDILA